MRTKMLASACLLCVTAACGTGSQGAWQTDSDAGTQEASAQDAPMDSDAGDEPSEDAAQDLAEELANADAAVGAGSLEQRSYAGPEGTRDFLLYQPSGYDGTPLPLIVALHGCNESAAHFAYVSQLNVLADSQRFVVAWPEQTYVANSMMCWNWFASAHQQRTTGEAAIIAGIARAVMQELAIDPKRVHAVGISAGGAMALVEGTIFPDVFASVASVEGCPFQGVPCVGSPSTLSGDSLAQLAASAMGSLLRPLPVFVVQGDADLNVAPANGELIVQQYLGVADTADDGLLNQSVSRQPSQSTSGSVPGGHTFDTDVFADSTGQSLIERWLIHGMGHAWPGGPSAIAYSDPAGPDASAEIVRFFSQHPLP